MFRGHPYVLRRRHTCVGSHIGPPEDIAEVNCRTLRKDTSAGLALQHRALIIAALATLVILSWRFYGSKALSSRSAICTHVDRGPTVFHRESRGRDSDIRKRPRLYCRIDLRRRRQEWC